MIGSISDRAMLVVLHDRVFVLEAQLKAAQAKSTRRKKALKQLNQSFMLRQHEWMRSARRILGCNKIIARQQYDVDSWRNKAKEMEAQFAGETTHEKT